MTPDADGGPVDFEAWLVALDIDEQPELRKWMQDLFDREGPVDKQTAGIAYALEQTALAERCVEIVVADLHRSSTKRPVITVDECEGSLRITVDGSYQTPSMFAPPWDEPAALAEVADYLQGEVVDNEGPVWPVCPTHDLGLHARVIDGRAVWCCQPSGHVVAEIGSLSI